MISVKSIGVFVFPRETSVLKDKNNIEWKKIDDIIPIFDLCLAI